MRQYRQGDVHDTRSIRPSIRLAPGGGTAVDCATHHKRSAWFGIFLFGRCPNGLGRLVLDQPPQGYRLLCFTLDTTNGRLWRCGPHRRASNTSNAPFCKYHPVSVNSNVQRRTLVLVVCCLSSPVAEHEMRACSDNNMTLYVAAFINASVT